MDPAAFVVLGRDEDRQLDTPMTCAEFLSITKNCLENEVVCSDNEFSCECPSTAYCFGFSNGTFVGTCPCPIFTGTLTQWIIAGVLLGLAAVMVIARIVYLRVRTPPVQLAAVVANPVDVMAVDNPLMEVPMALVINAEPQPIPKQKTTYFV